MKKNWLHFILIPLLLIYPVISSPDFDGTLSIFSQTFFRRDFVKFVLAILFFYVNLSVLLPRFWKKRKYVLYGVCVLPFYLLMVFLPYQIFPNVNSGRDNLPPPFPMNGMRIPPANPAMHLPPEMPNDKNIPPPFFMEFKRNFGETLHNKFFTTMFPFLVSFFGSLFIYKNTEQKELREAKAKADLLNLKYQLQPHLLFNTLNSIYSLALTKSDEAPEAILKLSNVMRYVVQENDKDFVDLNKEISYLKDYIGLQLMRTDESLAFHFSESGTYNHLKIAPLILVNFVENAFKYGYNAEEQSEINIELKVKDASLSFKAVNSIVNTENIEKESLNIGLKNTLERLDRLYKDNHTISIEDDAKKYTVELTMNLSKTETDD